MTRIVITGASGLIGRRIVPLLCDAGHEVHALGRSPARDCRVASHAIDLLAQGDGLGQLLSDIGASHALHLAWYAEPGKYWGAPENLDWVAASIRLARAFAAAGGQRLVVAGTCAEYDWSADGRLDEPTSPLRPATPYGEAKLALFQLLSRHAGAMGISLSWARIFFPFAADERPERLLGTLIAAARAGTVARFSAGTQQRDFIAAGDVARALVALLECNVEGAVNVATGAALTVREFIERAAALVGGGVALEFSTQPLGPDQPPLLVAATERLRVAAGFQVNRDLSASLREALREAGLAA